MKRITKIEATPVVQKKLRVAAYVRVSTSHEEQLTSLKAQKEHYEGAIKSNPAWEFAGIYVDEGISGTKIAKREALLDLLDDCESGKIDRVITKSISRFARNTTDCLMMVRKLTGLGIYLFFEKENIDTEHMDSELLLSIMSSLAESESKSISENAKWSINRRMKRGTYKMGTVPYGYRKDGDQILIDPKEADLVREIFQMSLMGYGCSKIANILNDRNIPTKKGCRWHHSTIGSMLRNEFYAGDFLMQKTYMDEGFHRRVNYGEKDMYMIQDHHEALVSHEDFDRANQMMQERGKGCKFVEKNHAKAIPTAFSKKLICGECGRILSKGKKKAMGAYHLVWECKNALKPPHSCSQRYILPEMVEYGFIRMMRKLQTCHSQVLEPFIDGLKGNNNQRVLNQVKILEEKIEKNEEQQKNLEQLMFAGLLEQEVFLTEKQYLVQQASEFAHELSEVRNSICGDLRHLEAAEQLLSLVSKRKPILTFDEEAFKAHVEKVTIVSREVFIFHLRCGLNLEERIG
ncbi:MAG: recombinase family protein [Lachnospiraceae bacterium]|nr:recombinase family protein [Lachnospiraceae bacterium]